MVFKSSDSSETNDYYEEYKDESSSSVMVLTTSSCTYDTSTTASRLQSQMENQVTSIHATKDNTFEFVSERDNTKGSTKGVKCKVSSCNTNPKSVKPTQKCTKFSDKPFTVSGDKLFCIACREELSLKWSIIKNHIQSTKHESSNCKENKAAKQNRIRLFWRL